MKLILGSSSKFRRMVMDELDVPYEVITPDIDEKAIRDADPEKLVLAIAHAKADAILARVHASFKEDEPTLIITADQVVVCNGEIREKPISPAQGKEFLLAYNAAPAIIVNGMTITNMQTGMRVQGTDIMHIWYAGITDEEAETLSHDENNLVSAGGLRFENPIMAHRMVKTDGTADASMGLPKKLLHRLLDEQNFQS